MAGLILLIAIQCLIFIVLAFGDIGFDRPGRFGLDFDDLLLLLVLYAGVLLTGFVFAIRKKRWWLAMLQLAMPLLVSLVTMLGPTFRQPLSAADYQHLVGKTKAEARNELGYRTSSSGFESNDRGERAFESYDGMTIYYSMDGIVLSVKAE